jgi:hypothetical protein
METPDEGEKESKAPDPKPEDEHSYEDNWYQVLRRRQAEGSGEEDEEAGSSENKDD